MPRNGPKGPPLFDVLASKRREPSALELALQAAAAERLVDAASAVTDPVSAGEGRAGSAADPAAPKSESATTRQLWAVELDDEPPLAAEMSAVERSGDMGAGPRIAAFAAATGAAVRRPTPPVKAVLAPDGPQAGGRVGTPPPWPDADEGQLAMSSDVGRAAEEPGAGGVPDAGTPAGEQVAEESVTQQPDSTGPRDSDEQSASDVAVHSVAGLKTSAAVSGAPSDVSTDAEEDDFGPLLVPEEPRRGRRKRRPKTTGEPGAAPAAAAVGRDVDGRPVSARRVGVRAGIAVGAGALTLLGLAAWGWLPSDTPVAVGSTAQASAVDAPQTAEGGDAASDVVMMPWHGIALPVSATSGPRVQGATASGFAHSALGAGIAAANLVVRVDPQAGASVYEPTLATQVVGDAEGLSHAVRDQARTSTDGGPPGALTGWRIDGDPTGSRVVAHLAVDPGADAGIDFAVPLAWVDSDWRIDAPTSGPFFPTSDLSGDYIPFVQEGSSS